MGTLGDKLVTYSTDAQLSYFFINKAGYIFVSSYGAVGDGVTDDTESVQNAIDAAVAAGKTEVHFVGGKTYLLGTLTSTDGLTFIGDNVTITGTSGIIVNGFNSHYAKVVPGLARDGNTDDSAVISAYLATLTAPDSVYIPPNTVWDYTTITHPDNIQIIDASTYDWTNLAFGAAQKIILKTDSPGTKNADEYQIISTYHPAIILDILDATDNASIIFRRNSSGTWQMGLRQSGGIELFSLRDLTSAVDQNVIQIQDGLTGSNEWAFNGTASNGISYKFTSRYVGTMQNQFISSDTDKDVLFQIYSGATEKWRCRSVASDGTLEFESRTSPAKKFILYPNGEIKWGSSARKITNGSKPSAGSDTWTQGDIWYNATPDVGETIGEICTVGGTPGTWKTFGQVGYRTNSGSPIGAITPKFVGEELLDTSGTVWYKSTGTGNTNWVALN